MSREDLLGLCAEAARNDDLAVLRERLADCVERLVYGLVDEAAGIDDDEVRRVVGGRNFVPFRTQLREDALENPRAPWGSRG
jgi:hypothetical protein